MESVTIVISDSDSDSYAEGKTVPCLCRPCEKTLAVEAAEKASTSAPATTTTATATTTTATTTTSTAAATTSVATDKGTTRRVKRKMDQ